MSKRIDNIILMCILVLFFFLFRSNDIVKVSVLSSCNLWFKTLVPAMSIMFLVVDLALNYGLASWFYKIFKNNKVLLIVLSFLLGTPTSTKYVKDFYKGGYISKEDAECILASIYSPNPLFILNISPSTSFALKLLLFIYLTDFFLYIIFKRKNLSSITSIKEEKVSFSKCLQKSSEATFNILVLVLGTIIFFGVINTLLSGIIPNNLSFLYSITELTNAIKMIKSTNQLEWIFFSIAFGGLSIHAQIKSILDDTSLSYKKFLFGRLIASTVSLIVIMLY